MIGRRAVLASAATLTGAAPEDPRIAAAASVFIYALPLYEVERTRARALAGGQPANRLSHIRALTDARSRWVTTPNVDTLYSTAWLDLTAGPVEIDLPPPSGRYVSLALMDAFSNNFAVLHPEDPGAERLTVIGPGAAAGAAHAAAGRTLVVSPTTQVWALVRTYVADQADLAAARQVQNGFRLAGPAVPGAVEPSLPAPVQGDPAAVFAGMAAQVRANPKPDEDGPVLTALASLGLGSGETPAPAEILAAGRAAALRQMRTPARARQAGWFYPKDDLGDFGRDYLYRAQVAVGGLAALPTREALYLSAAAGEGRLFRAGGDWRLRFGPGEKPPLDAFWSLTLYEPDASGGLYFFDNPERIYAIKSLDPGLRREADGGLTIVVARQRPADAAANWLPAPDGPFALIFRAYRPAPALLDGTYRMPAVEPA